MAAKKNTTAAQEPSEISDVLKVTTGTLDCYVVGTSPLVLNRMSEKAKHELLLPRGRMNQAQKATSLKHSPLDEYRASAYTLKNPSNQTFLAVMATAFKKAICNAALDMPGTRKAQVGRLTWVQGDMVGVYGLPKLFMAIVRSADMNRTPDVRTRAIVPAWACHFSVQFVKPLISVQAVANLLAAAGITIGVGDGRQEKGTMSYGQFRLASQDDPELLSIVKQGSREAQMGAIEHPTCYDDETTELLSWYEGERATRALNGVAAA